jgi:lysophospholipase L1-like esterase
MGRRLRGLATLVALSLLATGCASAPAGSKQPAPTEFPVPAGSVVGFYGDSMTSGFGASAPDRRWSSLLCAREGWTEVNPSIPGLGFVQSRGGTDLPGQIAAAAPDLVLVTLGLNDLGLVDSHATELQAAIASDLGTLRDSVPDAHIVVLALFSPLSFEPRQVAAVNGWLRASAADVDAVFVPKSAGWLAGHPDWTVDGIHLNDVGNAAIATLIGDELRRVL